MCKVVVVFVFLAFCRRLSGLLRRVVEGVLPGGVGDADVVDGLEAALVRVGLCDVPTEGGRGALHRGLDRCGDVGGAEHFPDLLDHHGVACTCSHAVAMTTEVPRGRVCVVRARVAERAVRVRALGHRPVEGWECKPVSDRCPEGLVGHVEVGRAGDGVEEAACPW